MIKSIAMPLNLNCKDWQQIKKTGVAASLISQIHSNAVIQLLLEQAMKNTLRKYHRLIATLFCLPLLFTALTGISIAIADEWLHQEALAAFLMDVHTSKILGLSAILPILNGIGLLGLTITGLSMTRLFSKRPQLIRVRDR